MLSVKLSARLRIMEKIKLTFPEGCHIAIERIASKGLEYESHTASGGNGEVVEIVTFTSPLKGKIMLSKRGREFVTGHAEIELSGCKKEVGSSALKKIFHSLEKDKNA